MIKQEQQVTWIQKAHCPESSWSVTTRNLRHGQQKESVYDALVVSSGHYTVPFIPSYIGIDQFNTEHPNVISHSKWFDDPHDYHNKVFIPDDSLLSPTNVDDYDRKYW